LEDCVFRHPLKRKRKVGIKKQSKLLPGRGVKREGSKKKTRGQSIYRGGGEKTIRGIILKNVSRINRGDEERNSINVEESERLKIRRGRRRGEKKEWLKRGDEKNTRSTTRRHRKIAFLKRLRGKPYASIT